MKSPTFTISCALAIISLFSGCGEKSPDVKADVKQKIEKDGNSFLTNIEYKQTDIKSTEDLAGFKFTAQATLARDAVTDLRVGKTLARIDAFKEVPTAASLEGSLPEIGAIYCLWKSGLPFSFAGEALQKKYKEGWRTEGLAYSLATQPPVESYILFGHKNGKVKEYRSAKPYIEAPLPDNDLVFATCKQTIEKNWPDLFKIGEMQILSTQQFEITPYIDNVTCRVKVNVTASFAAAKTYNANAKQFVDLPKIGDKTDTGFSGATYWDAGEPVSFSDTIDFSRAKTTDEWHAKFPTLGLKTDRKKFLRLDWKVEGNSAYYTKVEITPVK